MGCFLEFGTRLFQGGMYIASAFLDFSEPVLVKEAGALKKIPLVLEKEGKKRPLIVTDEGLFKLGLNKLVEGILNDAFFEYALFHGVTANPTINSIEEGLKVYLQNNCDSIIAIGGGSAMDAAKGIGARVSNPKKTVQQMKGVLKVRKKLPLYIAIPTTAGTGSETTVAAVVVDSDTNDKFAINDPIIIPDYAFLDPTLLVGLPKGLTSTTGMDALTHAVEAFIGHSNTKKTKKYAVSAVKLIFSHLELCCNDPTNIMHRESMQLASYKAGVAFTRAYVGTVHSIAHAVGGVYNVPHGLANAVILPKVLRAYGKSAYKKLALLADEVNIGSGLDNKGKALAFIEAVEAMNERMGITNSFGANIKDEDINFLVNHAYKETVPLYPVPRILSKNEIKEIYLELQKGK